MTVLGRLALLVLIVPILEIVLLVQLGQAVGLWPTLALVMLTGVIGAGVARLGGVWALLQFRKELASGRIPGQSLLDGISVLVGGALLLFPGILTDLAGLALIFPPSRRWMQRRARKRLERSLRDGTFRVMTMGPAGFGHRGPEGRGAAREQGPDVLRGLDPSKGIVVEPDEP